MRSERDRETQDLTTEDTQEHGGETIAKIAGIAKESKLENQILSPQRTQRSTEEKQVPRSGGPKEKNPAGRKIPIAKTLFIRYSVRSF